MFSPGRGWYDVRGVLEQDEGGCQDGPDAQQVDGNIDRVAVVGRVEGELLL